MIKYAITGNIASGKTVIQNFLEENGEKVLDTDIVGHELLENDIDVIDVFKGYDILDKGRVSREKLGKIVFNDNVMLEKLNSILHPRIKEKILDFFEENAKEDRVFVGIPLLFECKMESLFDKIIFVYADDDIRLKRLMKRNGYSNDFAQKRLASQIPQDDKLKKADFVLYNNGTVEELKSKVCKILSV